MILDRLVEASRQAMLRRQATVPIRVLEGRAQERPRPLSLARALRSPGVSIIAEVKRASPSKGTLNRSLDAAALAAEYARAGAQAISVLTEESHFGGSLDDLGAAREGLRLAHTECPLLYKGFVVDRYQLLEALAWGADAVLLIVAALGDGRLNDLYRHARSLGFTPLVEVHSRDELDRALEIGPEVIGINNRDLRTFQVDLGVTAQLRRHVPRDCVLVSESGIREPQHVRDMAALGVDAVLVGEALVTSEDAGTTLRALKKAGL